MPDVAVFNRSASDGGVVTALWQNYGGWVNVRHLQGVL